MNCSAAAIPTELLLTPRAWDDAHGEVRRKQTSIRSDRAACASLPRDAGALA
jgi:hypothetical protein